MKSIENRTGLALFFLFTIVAVTGYGTFGRHPNLLAAYRDLAPFYAVAFRFFAQAHVVVAALVLAYVLVRKMGLQWIPAFVLVYGASLASELIGTSTGLPFGAYGYSGLLGWKWFDLVPALIPLSWFLMAVPAYVMAGHRYADRPVQRILLGAALLTAWDLALDPAMSSLTNYWSWADAGPYYGMPLINVAGWMLTGIVLISLLHAVMRRETRLSPAWCAAYYGLTILMPLGMMAAAGLWTGVAVSVVAAAGLVLVALSAPRSLKGDRPSAAHTDEDPSAFVRRRAAEAEGAPPKFFARHSRSFSFAARWFGADERQLVAGLYAFCRTTDDLADRDRPEPVVVEARLNAWLRLVEVAYDSASTGIRWLDDIMAASVERGVPIELIRDLVRGARMDAGRVRMRTWEELDLYMYRVASVVGIWMCHLFGVTDPASHRRAAALGRAMQLTNILRDVGEDLNDDRIYLPTEVLDRYEITPDRLRDLATRIRDGGDVPPAYRAMMHEVIGRAEALYELAHPGLAALPPSFARAAAVASSVYHGIHREIRRNRYDNLQQRAVTSMARKVYLAARGLSRLSDLLPKRAASASAALRKAAASTAAVVLLCLLPGPPVAAAFAGSACPELSLVRDQYIRAVEVEEQIKQTRDGIRDCSAPIYRAYDGALVVLKGKHAFWPVSKLRYVRAGLAVLDSVAADHPEQVEIRFLRLLSGYFLPGFFGRRDEVREDFRVLAVRLPAAREAFPDELYEVMIEFVLRHGHPSDERREALVAALGEEHLSP